MPITVIAPEGLFTPQGEKDVLLGLSELLLKWNGATGNTFMTPMVAATMHVLPPARALFGLKPETGVIVELKLPSLALATQEQKQGFVTDATTLVDRLTPTHHPKERTFFNTVYAVDGSWAFGGHAYINAELGVEITQATVTETD